MNFKNYIFLLVRAFVGAVMLFIAPDGLMAASPTPPLRVFPTIQSDAIGQKLQSAMIWSGAESNKT